MLTLALDTTADFGSIALLRDDDVLAEILLHAPQGFSHILFQQIETLLDRCAIKLGDIDLYAAASGPGSFTGVRVGLAAIKGFAEVHGLRAVAVSNLAAIAKYGTAAHRAAVIDARRGEVYAALYNAVGEAIIDEQVIPFPAFLKILPSGPIQWVSQDFTPFQSPKTTNVITAPRALAASIAVLARRSIPTAPEAIDANYVRRSDAELLWKESV